jgi:hypothetical protein
VGPREGLDRRADRLADLPRAERNSIWQQQADILQRALEKNTKLVDELANSLK